MSISLRDALVKSRDSLPFSLILSILIHIAALYYIGSWVIDFGKLLGINHFIINEIPIENQPRPTITLREINKDPQTKEK